jgi:hypothetical protein
VKYEAKRCPDGRGPRAGENLTLRSMTIRGIISELTSFRPGA